MSSSTSLTLRAILAIILMIGFYILALAIAFGLLYLIYAMVVYGHRLNIRLTIFALVGAGVILWSIIPRPDNFVPPGPLLQSSRHPKLFAVIKQIAKGTKQEMPAEVYLVPEINAWVTHRGGVMGVGSRRVMGLGLPLLQILTGSQFRAVLAHEFGHYYGGDVKLGPWIYKTRSAIGRTIMGLGDSLLQKPFMWYGKMFLRITQAISRRQEFAADALASRAVGARPLIEGLQAIHGGALAFQYYWQNEVSPVLNAGFRPPLAEGFGRFVTSKSVAASLAKATEQEIAEGKANLYDTHPPLRERIAAIKKLPQGEPPAEDPPAIFLLDDVPKLEADLLTALAGRSEVQALQLVQWPEVGSKVYLPIWANIAREQRSGLDGVTPAHFPHLVKNLSAFTSRLKRSHSKALSPDEQRWQASSVLGSALAVALQQQSWRLHAQPGEAVRFERGEVTIKPFESVQRLIAGQLPAEEWQQHCSEAGIADLDLGQIPPAEQETS